MLHSSRSMVLPGAVKCGGSGAKHCLEPSESSGCAVHVSLLLWMHSLIFSTLLCVPGSRPVWIATPLSSSFLLDNGKHQQETGKGEWRIVASKLASLPGDWGFAAKGHGSCQAALSIQHPSPSSGKHTWPWCDWPQATVFSLVPSSF